MKFSDMLGQVFRDVSGMPPKVRTFNSRLKVYDGISEDISQVKDLTVRYFEEGREANWLMLDAEKMKLESDMLKGIISFDDYVLQSSLIEEKRERVIDDFVSFADSYFTIAYKNKLYSVKDRYKRDPYVSLMEFNTWFDMKAAKELAELAALQIRCSDEYVDAQKIAEIYERYKRDRHMRRGR